MQSCANAAFVAKAPEEVIDEQKEKRAEAKPSPHV